MNEPIRACSEPGCGKGPDAPIHKEDAPGGHFYNRGAAIATRATTSPEVKQGVPVNARRVPPQMRTMNWLLEQIMETNRKLAEGSIDLDVAAKIQVGHKHMIRLGDLSLQAARVHVDRRFPNNEVPLLWTPAGEEEDKP